MFPGLRPPRLFAFSASFRLFRDLFRDPFLGAFSAAFRDPGLDLVRRRRTIAVTEASVGGLFARLFALFSPFLEAFSPFLAFSRATHRRIWVHSGRWPEKAKRARKRRKGEKAKGPLGPPAVGAKGPEKARKAEAKRRKESRKGAEKAKRREKRPKSAKRRKGEKAKSTQNPPVGLQKRPPEKKKQRFFDSGRGPPPPTTKITFRIPSRAKSENHFSQPVLAISPFPYRSPRLWTGGPEKWS